MFQNITKKFFYGVFKHTFLNKKLIFSFCLTYITLSGDIFILRKSFIFNHLQTFGPVVASLGDSGSIFTGKKRHPGNDLQSKAGPGSPEWARKPADSNTHDSIECSTVSPKSIGVIGNSHVPPYGDPGNRLRTRTRSPYSTIPTATSIPPPRKPKLFF